MIEQMATKPIGADTENLTINVRKGLPGALSEIARKLGISRNQLLKDILSEAIETGEVYRIPVRRMEGASVAAQETKPPPGKISTKN